MKTKTLLLGLALLPLLSMGNTGNTTPNLENSEKLSVKIEKSDLNSESTDLKSWIIEITINVEKEEELCIESWMTDLRNKTWDTASSEMEMEVENWMLMLDGTSWVKATNETEMEIEEWMTDPSNWL